MKREDIIRMAREAGLWLFNDSEGHCDGITDVELITAEKDRDDDRLVEILMPFATLVATAERERIIAANAPEIEKVNVYIKALEDAVAAEREACAYLCDRVAEENRHVDEQAELCAFAIRERGAP